MGIKKYRSSAKDQEVLESAKAREVVHEVMNFGVSQSQILTIIKLLSLELEDLVLMKSINTLIDGDLQEENIEKTTTIIT